jgi:hypothetical protein
MVKDIEVEVDANLYLLGFGLDARWIHGWCI